MGTRTRSGASRSRAPRAPCGSEAQDEARHRTPVEVLEGAAALDEGRQQALQEGALEGLEATPRLPLQRAGDARGHLLQLGSPPNARAGARAASRAGAPAWGATGVDPVSSSPSTSGPRVRRRARRAARRGRTRPSGCCAPRRRRSTRAARPRPGARAARRRCPGSRGRGRPRPRSRRTRARGGGCVHRPAAGRGWLPAHGQPVGEGRQQGAGQRLVGILSARFSSGLALHEAQHLVPRSQTCRPGPERRPRGVRPPRSASSASSRASRSESAPRSGGSPRSNGSRSARSAAVRAASVERRAHGPRAGDAPGAGARGAGRGAPPAE